NFAYDPINYVSLCRLRIMDLFLDILDADQEAKDSKKSRNQLVELALGGICNCIPDPQLQQQFIDGEGLEIVEPYILETLEKPTTSELNVTVSALTIAYFLLDSTVFAHITSDKFMTKMQTLQDHSSTQIANTANAFITRYQELMSTSVETL
ncbi:hypothetical protein PHMEG_00037764, partial [Phytophthora megakarya]